MRKLHSIGPRLVVALLLAVWRLVGEGGVCDGYGGGGSGVVVLRAAGVYGATGRGGRHRMRPRFLGGGSSPVAVGDGTVARVVGRAVHYRRMMWDRVVACE